MRDLLSREPVLVRALIMSGVLVLFAFGVQLSDVQLQAIDSFVLALLAVLPVVLGVDARSKVTPVVKDEDDGE